MKTHFINILHLAFALGLIALGDPTMVQAMDIKILGSLQNVLMIIGYAYFAMIISFIIPDARMDQEYKGAKNDSNVMLARAIHQLGFCIIIAVLLFKVIL